MNCKISEAKSNYRKIGDFIELVDERNKDLSINLLLGLSVTKEFIPSVANTVGTNMKNYKIIRKGQFACSVMQVRRDKKMPVALLQDFEEAIISQAYPVFQIKDETVLLPEYLMMWFTRSEFDREACFYAVGGVRGSLEWEDFLNMKLPIPSIEKQRAIVKEYNTVVNRIKLNEQLNQKLEETVRELLKELLIKSEENVKGTLMDFIFSANTGLDAIKRAPIVYENTGRRCLRIQDVSRDNNFQEWGFTNVNDNNFERFQLVKNDIIIARTGATVGVNMLIQEKLDSVFNNGLIRVRVNINKIYPCILFAFFNTKSFRDHVESIAFGTSTQPNVKIRDLFSQEVIFPSILIQTNIVHQFNIPYKSICLNKKEIGLLMNLKNLLLSKMTKVESEKMAEI